MSCKHGNNPDACDICEEVDAAYKSGVADGSRAAPSVASAAKGDDRQRFEAWLRSVWTDGYDCRRCPGGDSYASGEAQNYWTAWQAAIAAASQQAAQPKAAMTDEKIIATYNVNGFDIVRTVRAIEAASGPNAAMVDNKNGK